MTSFIFYFVDYLDGALSFHGPFMFSSPCLEDVILAAGRPPSFLFPTHLTLSDYVFSLLTRFFPNQITLCLPLCFHSPFYLSLWALSTFSSFGDGWVSIYTSFLPPHCTSFKAEINPTYFCPFLKMLYSLKEKWVPAPYNPFCPQQPGYFFQKHNWDYAAPLPKPSSGFPLHWSQILPPFQSAQESNNLAPTCLAHPHWPP